MIHLTNEGKFPREKRQIKRDAWKDNIIIRHNFTGVKLSPEEFQEFQEIVNERRPYCREDFIPQSFIPDLSSIKY